MKKSYVCLLFLILIMACNPASTSQENTAVGKWWTEKDRSFIISELNRTTEALKAEVENTTDEQWHFHERPSRWSIAEIVEHLEMQNQLHYREISVVSNAPQYLEFRLITAGNDQYFSNYSIDNTRSQARWFLEPLDRFASKQDGVAAFYRARGKLIEFVEETEIDLRKQFTFRTPVEGKEVSELKIGQVRDLHQLLLTGIAHTDRHLGQIRNIKLHEDYPKSY
ncbi:MAG: DinB family protein [Cyclobacteriaceae bacterium]